MSECDNLKKVELILVNIVNEKLNIRVELVKGNSLGVFYSFGSEIIHE